LVAFICNHCPYVKHIKPQLAQLGRELAERGVAMVAISANDPEAYPEDAPKKMAEDAGRFGYVFPYLFDDTQEVAKAFLAACTPEFYVFDPHHALTYRGQLDDSRVTNGKLVTGRSVRTAIDCMLRSEPYPDEQIPSIGCNIKWRRGNEPSWL
jgi:thiol-disulfide isomerase/thioredoxin